MGALVTGHDANAEFMGTSGSNERLSLLKELSTDALPPMGSQHHDVGNQAIGARWVSDRPNPQNHYL